MWCVCVCVCVCVLQLAAEHAAAGSFQSAMSLLHRQLGVADFEPLRPYFIDLYTASHATVAGLTGAPAMITHLDRYEPSSIRLYVHASS